MHNVPIARLAIASKCYFFLQWSLKKSIEEGGSEVLSTCVHKHAAKRHTNNVVSLFSNFLCILFYYRDKEWQISVFAKCNFLCWLGRRCVTVLYCKYLNLVVVKKRRGRRRQIVPFFQSRWDTSNGLIYIHWAITTKPRKRFISEEMASWHCRRQFH